MMQARGKYGGLNINRDGRDFLKETEEELLDAMNYLAFEVLRLRMIKEKNVFQK